MKARLGLPAEGLDPDAITRLLEQYRERDVDWRAGKLWAYVFDPGEQAERVIKQAYMAYLSENGLDPTAFPSLLRFENEVVAMAIGHLGGDADVVGNFTSGGTESIMLAVKSARDWARSRRPDLRPRRAKIVAPTTAHAAFHKAAHYLDLELVTVDVDPISFEADVAAMAAAIDDDTIMLVGSAVSYAHSVVDPITELGALAIERGLWLHVDGCMGGFLLPYFRRLGRAIPAFDFAVPGVSSISMDLHKYAFAAKGASVVLYRDRELRRHQIFTCAAWTGYTMSNATVQSSKSGGPVAAAWAVMRYFGDAGYLELARRVLAGTERVVAFVDAHPDLRVLGRPAMNHVAIASDTVPLFRLAEAIDARGWFMQVQLSYANSPANIHLCINPVNLAGIDQLLADIAAAVDEVRDAPSSPLLARLQPMLAQIDIAALDGPTLRGMMAMAGIEPGSGAAIGAEINELFDFLDAPARARVVTEFMNELFVPSPIAVDERGEA
ncbi:pyridoxal phosphate-dependent decarboxylase family protein [Nannocystaceae bacterium ST9]